MLTALHDNVDLRIFTTCFGGFFFEMRVELSV